MLVVGPEVIPNACAQAFVTGNISFTGVVFLLSLIALEPTDKVFCKSAYKLDLVE